MRRSSPVTRVTQRLISPVERRPGLGGARMASGPRRAVSPALGISFTLSARAYQNIRVSYNKNIEFPAL